MRLIGLVNRSLPLVRHTHQIQVYAAWCSQTLSQRDNDAHKSYTWFYEWIASCILKVKPTEFLQLELTVRWRHWKASTLHNRNCSSCLVDWLISRLSYRQLAAWWVKQKFGFFAVQFGWGRAFQMVDKLDARDEGISNAYFFLSILPVLGLRSNALESIVVACAVAVVWDQANHRCCTACKWVRMG